MDSGAIKGSETKMAASLTFYYLVQTRKNYTQISWTNVILTIQRAIP